MMPSASAQRWKGITIGQYDPLLLLFLILLVEYWTLRHVIGVDAASAAASVGVNFILLSVAASRFPFLIHGEKKRLRFKSTHISHRGGAGERIENTLSAFENAEAQGTDMFELDCQLTKDLQVVVAHDDDLLRLCGVEGKISTTNFKDLPPLKTELPIDYVKNGTTKFACENGKSHETIPLLEEVFRRFPEMAVNIDPKSSRAVNFIGNLIHKYNREDTVAWGSHQDDVVCACHEFDPNIPLIFSEKRFYRLLFLHFIGFLPFIRLEEALLEIPIAELVVRRSGHGALGLPESSAVTFALPFADFIIFRCGLIGHLKRRGIKVLIWVINENEDYQAAFDAGFEGIMTDFPQKLRQFLDTQVQRQDASSTGSDSTLQR